MSGGPSGRTILYLARRYFKLSNAEWGALPWWETEALIEGLKDEGVIEGGKSKSNQGAPQSAPVVDLTGAGPVPHGFTTRRAG